MPDLHGEHVLVDVHVPLNAPVLLLVEVLVEVLTVFVCEYWPTVDLRLVGPRKWTAGLGRCGIEPDGSSPWAKES